MKINPRVAIMREVVVKTVQILATRNVKVTQRGTRAYVSYDPRTLEPTLVNVPFIPDDADDKLLDAIQGFMDHELGHIFWTDAKELLRAKKLGVGSLHNTIEDTFIERKQCENFKGCAINLENVGRFFLANYTDKKIKEDAKNIVSYLMVPAMRAWAGQLLFQEYMDDGDKWRHLEDITKRLGPKLIERVAKVNSSKDAVDLALDMTEALSGKKPAPPPPAPAPKPAPKKDDDEKFEEDDEDEDDAGTAAGEKGEGDEKPSKGEKGAGTPGKPKSEEEDDDDAAPGDDDEKFDDSTAGEGDDDEKFTGTTPGEEEDDLEGTAESGTMGESEFGEGDDDESFGGDLEDPEGDAAAGKTEEAKSGTGLEEEDEEHEDLTGALSGIEDYDESLSGALGESAAEAAKKSEYVIWTRDFDVVETLDLADYDERSLKPRLESMQQNSDAMVGVMQKDLERAIASRNRSTWRGGLRKGRISASNLSRLAVNDDRVFRKKEIAISKDVALTLLCDNSGSMASRNRIQLASEAAFALSSVLDRMNITHEVIGFTTKSGGYPPAEFRKAEEELKGGSFARALPLYMPIYKGFDERLTPETKRRIAAMGLANFLYENVDGECVQVAAQRLLGRKEKRRIMLVLSDGQPSAGRDTRRLQKHLKDSVALVAKSGVEVIGIGIETDSVASYYPKYVVLNKANELAGEVMQKLRQILLA